MTNKKSVFIKILCLLLCFAFLLCSCTFDSSDKSSILSSVFSSKTVPHVKNVLFDPGELTEPFDYERFDYTVDIPTEYDHVNITPVLDPGLEVEIINPEHLEYGNNDAKVIVTYGEETFEYDFIINRLASDNADLNSLSVSGFEFDKPFSPTEYNYTVEVGAGTDKIDIIYELADDNASCEITGGDFIDFGENAVTVTVTSQSRNVSNNYNITVIKNDSLKQYFEMIDRGEGKFIAITFDDGPSPYTNKLLDILQKHQIKATFYLVGNRLEHYPDEAKREAADGHALGNHTWNHSYLKKALSDDQKKELLDKTDDVLYEMAGQKTTTFRPPGGIWDRSIKEFDDKRVVFWTVDPEDWKDRDTDIVVERIMNYAKDNSIILLHDLYLTSVNAADIVIGRLKDKGYTFVTVDELLQIREYRAELEEKQNAQ